MQKPANLSAQTDSSTGQGALNISPATTIQRMHAFTGDLAVPHIKALGNPCAVIVSNARPSLRTLASAVSEGITRCYTWPKNTRAAEVACYTAAGTEIQCCGHGLLSCAKVWTTLWGDAGSLHSGHSEVLCTFQDDALWLGFSGQEYAVAPAAQSRPPRWLETLLGTQIVHCSKIGNSEGYLIAQLEPDYDLSQIDPPGDSLLQHTRRALIVTCKTDATHSIASEHFHFRYFAPQYGVPEDPATGSAMRLLTNYWQTYLPQQHLLALQCSPSRGWLRGYISKDRVWVGGRVELETGSRA